MLPRLNTLLFILIRECNVPSDQINIKESIDSEKIFRKKPYFSVFVPSLNRLIIVCDESENRTDMFDTSKSDYILMGREKIERLTKEEKDEYSKSHPGSHIKIFFSNNWSDRIFTHLTESLPEKEKDELKIKRRPKDIELALKTDEFGFYTDEYGEKWCSARTASKKLFNNDSLYHNKNFLEMLRNMESKKISAGVHAVDGYKFSEIEKEMKNNPEFSAFYRKTDNFGFYTDETTGEKWCSIDVFSRKVLGHRGVTLNVRFRELAKSAETLKILSRNKIIDAYKVSELEKIIKADDRLKKYLITNSS